jgi:hypothetical protein
MKKFILIFITTVTITTIALQSMAKEAPFPAFVSSGDLKTLNYLSQKTNNFAVAKEDSCLFYAKKGRLLANQLKQPLIETGFLTGTCV